MPNRRDFIRISTAGALTAAGPLAAGSHAAAHGSALPGSAAAEPSSVRRRASLPIVVSTWNHGIPANEAAWQILHDGGSALDAAEAGVRVTEADPTSRTVGIGGRPDAKGRVTLDASIMDDLGRCGAVAFLEHIKHPISVARKVMEETPHVMLVGEGALEFALEHGFQRENLLTPESETEWRRWLEESGRTAPPEINIENRDRGPNGGENGNGGSGSGNSGDAGGNGGRGGSGPGAGESGGSGAGPGGSGQGAGGSGATGRIDADNHDTIGMLTLDRDGRLAGACTTSGAQYKLHGRVGDSPIIGAGLFVDQEVGAACATGWGEAVIRVAGSHLVVELMRQGHAPEEACRLAVERVIRKNADVENLQVGFLALDRSGRFGAYAVESGFEFAIHDADDGNRLLPASSSR